MNILGAEIVLKLEVGRMLRCREPPCCNVSDRDVIVILDILYSIFSKQTVSKQERR